MSDNLSIHDLAMFTQTFIKLYDRDLRRLTQQIDAYADERQLWALAPGISNSAGNLCLHLIGNLNHYIGATLGNTGYVRDRPGEFSAKNVPKATLLANLTKTRTMLNTTLALLTDEQITNPYPLDEFGYPMTVHFFLVHLSGHLTYHLGQIDYHRRLLTQAESIPYEI